MNNYVLPVILQAFDATALTANYQAINPGGLPKACSLVRLVNSSNVDVYISFDGANDNDFILSENQVTFPFQANSSPLAYNHAALKQGSVLYVRQDTGAGSGGDILVIGYYQPL